MIGSGEMENVFNGMTQWKRYDFLVTETWEIEGPGGGTIYAREGR